MLPPMKKVLFFFILSSLSFSFDTFYFVPVFGDSFDNGISRTDKLIKLVLSFYYLYYNYFVPFVYLYVLFAFFFELMWSLFLKSVLGFPNALSWLC